MRIERSNPVNLNVSNGSRTDITPNNQAEAQLTDEYIHLGKELAKAVDTANSKLQVYNSKLEFSVHKKTGDIMIKVLDLETNEVIREIPPRKIIDLIASMLEQAGLLVNERA
ncbi:MAG TPA: flagellar protein FlaG [Candidatus Atribacteria bacterium]|nr:flagellar protein FlaG [Candidatus Atribacteria bacterium]